MGILSQFVAEHTQQEVRSFRSRAVSVDMEGSMRAAPGVVVNASTAMGVPAYYAGIRAISEDLGKIPFGMFKRLTPRGREPFPEHPMHILIHNQPNPDMSAMSWRETTIAHAMGWGNGYSEIARNGRGDPVALWPIHPSRVDITRGKNGRLVYLIKNNTGIPTEIESDNMFHLKGLGPDGIIGYSVLKLAIISLGETIAAQKFGLSFLGNSIRPSAVLQHPGTMEPEALSNLRVQWNDLYKGPENTGRMAILEQGMEYKSITIPPEEAQYLETRNFQVSEIARWLRITPHKIQDLSRATFSNVEQLATNYVDESLVPWAVRLEQEVWRKGIKELDRSTVFARHTFLGLLRGDQAARSAFYREMFNFGAFSADDIRELEDVNPIGHDGGTTYFVQGNLSPSEDAAKGRPEPEPRPFSGGSVHDEEEEEESNIGKKQYDNAMEIAHGYLAVFQAVCEHPARRNANMQKASRGSKVKTDKLIEDLVRLADPCGHAMAKLMATAFGYQSYPVDYHDTVERAIEKAAYEVRWPHGPAANELGQGCHNAAVCAILKIEEKKNAAVA